MPGCIVVACCIGLPLSKLPHDPSRDHKFLYFNNLHCTVATKHTTMAMQQFLIDLFATTSLEEVSIVVDNPRSLATSHSSLRPPSTRTSHSSRKEEKSRCRWRDLKRQNSDSCLMAVKPSRGSPISRDRKCRWRNLSRQESDSNLMKPERKSSTSKSPRTYLPTKKVASDSALDLPRRYASPRHPPTLKIGRKNADWSNDTMSSGNNNIKSEHDRARKIVDEALGLMDGEETFLSPIRAVSFLGVNHIRPNGIMAPLRS